MRNPRASLLLVAILFAGCGLAGCGSEKEGVVLRFLDRPDDRGAWREIISRFEQLHPEIDVELVEGPASTDTRESLYATAFLSGDTTYDLVYMDVIWVPRFAASGWLLPLEDRLAAEERSDFLPGDIAGSIYEGQLYRIPVRSDAGLLFYRKDLIPTAPETFAELEQLARDLSDPPRLHGFVYPARQYEGLVCTFLEILWGHGGDVLAPDGTVVLDSPEAIQALAWMAATIGTISPEGVTTYQEEEARHVFHEGHALFLRNWPYVWTKAQEEGSPVRGRVGIAPMVHVEGVKSAATLGGWGFGIAATCESPEAAWQFIEFASSAESMKILNRLDGAIPARRSLYQDPEILAAHPHYPELLEVLLAARPRPVHPRYAQISDVLQVQVSSALVGRRRPEEAIREAAAAIREILEQ